VQVDANTLVPLAHVRDGQITLNIGALATNRLVIGNEAIEFQARFNGITENLYVPIGTISAIFARETGAGMGFEVEPTIPSESTANIDGQVILNLMIASGQNFLLSNNE
jgi:stringent starvation protein B